MLRSSQSGRLHQATSPKHTCVEQDFRVVQGKPIFQSYCAVGCGSRVASRGCAHFPRTERPRVSQRTCPGRAWKKGTRPHCPGPGHSPPLLATGHTSAEDWAGRPSASSVRESRRSPILHTLDRRSRALCVGEGSCFYSLHKRESAHHTACQAPFLSRRSARRQPPCSPTPIPPNPPRTASDWST